MLSSDYIYSKSYKSIDEIDFKDNILYIYGDSPEDRGAFCENIKNSKLLKLTISEDGNYIIHDKKEIKLSELDILNKIICKYKSENIYIDVSSLSCKLCSLIFNIMISLLKENLLANVFLLYIEPKFYKIEEFKTEGKYHDLSEKIEGIKPLPLLKTIMPDSDDDKICFVPFLGFEGGRLAYIYENTMFNKSNVIPILGVSGFRVEYPFVSILGNKNPSIKNSIWNSIEYAKANSIVSAYTLLHKIHKSQNNCKLKIAPIGTKPHAIASILYALKNPKNTEIVYDNPKRKKKRTEGIGKITITDFKALLSYK